MVQGSLEAWVWFYKIWSVYLESVFLDVENSLRNNLHCDNASI